MEIIEAQFHVGYDCNVVQQASTFIYDLPLELPSPSLRVPSPI